MARQKALAPGAWADGFVLPGAWDALLSDYEDGTDEQDDRDAILAHVLFESVCRQSVGTRYTAAQMDELRDFLDRLERVCDTTLASSRQRRRLRFVAGLSRPRGRPKVPSDEASERTLRRRRMQQRQGAAK